MWVISSVLTFSVLIFASAVSNLLLNSSTELLFFKKYYANCLQVLWFFFKSTVSASHFKTSISVIILSIVILILPENVDIWCHSRSVSLIYCFYGLLAIVLCFPVWVCVFRCLLVLFCFLLNIRHWFSSAHSCGNLLKMRLKLSSSREKIVFPSFLLSLLMTEHLV